MELTISYQNNIMNVRDETSSNTYSEENTWTLIESSQYSQLKYAKTTNTFSVTLIICIIFVIGIITSVGVFKWYTKKKDIFMKI